MLFCYERHQPRINNLLYLLTSFAHFDANNVQRCERHMETTAHQLWQHSQCSPRSNFLKVEVWIFECGWTSFFIKMLNFYECCPIRIVKYVENSVYNMQEHCSRVIPISIFYLYKFVNNPMHDHYFIRKLLGPDNRALKIDLFQTSFAFGPLSTLKLTTIALWLACNVLFVNRRQLEHAKRLGGTHAVSISVNNGFSYYFVIDFVLFSNWLNGYVNFNGKYWFAVVYCYAVSLFSTVLLWFNAKLIFIRKTECSH